ncbi:MAG: PEP-CTERM sorting domain-containing protein [Planctomycetota bacterium]
MRYLVAFLAVGLLGATANATIWVQESFTHPDGNLVGQTPEIGGTWATHSGTIGPVQVGGGAITLVQSAAATQDVNTGTGTAMAAGDRWYAGFDLSVTGGTTNVYFAMFMEGSSLFDGRIWLTAPASGGNYRLALSNDNSITDADGEVFTGDLSFGTEYRVVHYYDYTAMAAKLWIDPVNESSPGFLAADPGYSDEVAAYAFRQAGGNSQQQIDNLVVATTFNEAVPEPGSLVLLALGGLAILRRRR